MTERKIKAMHATYGQERGVKCYKCEHLIPYGGTFRCEAYGLTDTSATAWSMWWSACGMLGQPLPDGYVPLYNRPALRRRDTEPVLGQMSMFEEVE